MQTFVQLGSKKMVYQLDLRKCIYQLVGPTKKYEIYQLIKDKNISKSTIYQRL
jgi:Fe2+ or Zn2+ uptake regulation protein